jgi:GNAT superfamily N-acetyltransferase
MPVIDFKKKCREIKELNDLIGFKELSKRLIYSRHEEVILVRDLKDIPGFTSENKLEMRCIAKEHLPQLALFRKQNGVGGEDPVYQLNVYLENGWNGLMADIDGQIIGYGWWGDHKSKFDFDLVGYEYYRKKIDLKPTDMFGFDFYISPRYRKEGNAIKFIHKYFQVLRGLGYERFFTGVRKDNIAAFWLYKTVGGKEVEKITVRRFFLYFLFKNLTFFFCPDGDEWLFDTRTVYRGKKKLKKA